MCVVRHRGCWPCTRVREVYTLGWGGYTDRRRFSKERGTPPAAPTYLSTTTLFRANWYRRARRKSSLDLPENMGPMMSCSSPDIVHRLLLLRLWPA